MNRPHIVKSIGNWVISRYGLDYDVGTFTYEIDKARLKDPNLEAEMLEKRWVYAQRESFKKALQAARAYHCVNMLA